MFFCYTLYFIQRVVIQTVEYFISPTALKQCRFEPLGVTRGGLREFYQCCKHKSSPLHFFLSLFFMYKSVQAAPFLYMKKIRQCRSHLQLVPPVTKLHGDFDSVKREQDCSASQRDARCRVCMSEKGESEQGRRRGVSAMRVWEVVLARFKINDLNMCSS